VKALASASSGSESEEVLRRQGRSKRICLLWGISLVLLLTLGLASWLYVLPVLKTRNAVTRCGSYDGSSKWEADVHAEAERLGGTAETRRCLVLYLAFVAKRQQDRRTAVRMLGVLGKGGDDQLPSLLRYLADKDSGVRESAAWALGKAHQTRAVPHLVTALADENVLVRKSAALALGRLRDQRAVDALAETLKDQHFAVRWAATLALGEIGSARAIRPLLVVLKDKDATVHYAAVESLAMIGEPAVGALGTTLRDGDERTSQAAAAALGLIGGSNAARLLRQALRDERAGVRRAAQVALKGMRSKEDK
jgi:HEAT repeat protein